ncbi:MAG: HAMP domain-containing methyl-accepting chemotaxis protein [Lacrimispora sp.]|uniref:methyl-accepting chemotaxis protein n=1 Tax=Lacrimispora sp. TaxID=2719234 RepID=UPI0039E54714
MKGLKIGKRIAAAFGVILVLFLIVSGVSIIGLRQNNGRLVDFFGNGHKVALNAMEMRLEIQAAAKNMAYATLSTDLNDTEQYIKSADSNVENFMKGIQFLREKYKGDKAILDKLEADIKELEIYKNEVFELARQNKSRQATEVFFGSVNPALAKIRDGLTEIGSQVDQVTDADFKNSQREAVFLQLLVVVVQIIAVLTALGFSYFLTKRIVTPIKEIEKAAKEMAEGSLHVSLNYQSRDELGLLSDSMRNTISNIRTIIEDITYLTGEMAEGRFQFNSRCPEKYVLDYSTILVSLGKLRDNLSDSLYRISESAGLVANGSDQVSSGAQTLSQGATEQASSIQELAASISDISNQINNNAQSAKEARITSEETANNVAKSNEKMDEMNQAMTEISHKSNEIGKIIKTIEDIAFQTNILALNAAVEAARAGEAGKGFAVVADEVRNLASKSGEAAKNTTALIEESMRAVEKGTKITAETAKAMHAVVESSQLVNIIIESIAMASDLQATAVNEVSLGIDQISSVVQTNSATAEQSAAASEELSGQAQIMKGLLSRFNLHGVEEKKEKTCKSVASPYYTPMTETPVLDIDPSYFDEPSSFGGGKY